MKQTIRIDLPARDYGRLPRRGKHTFAKPPRVILGGVEETQTPGANGAFGNLRKRSQEKQRFLAASSSQANRLQREREQDRLVAEFVAGLDGKDRAFAEATGLAAPLADTSAFADVESTDGEESSERDAADGATGEFGTQNGRLALQPRQHPVLEILEPRAAAAVEDLTPGEIAEAHDAFGRGLAWVHDAGHLVKKGRRLATFCALVRPDLACGVSEQMPAGLRADLLRWLDADLTLLGLVFGRVFTWCREAASLSALGLRGDIIAYVIRPTLLDAATNAQLGSEQNNTRQAVNKLVQDFRDTFAGIRARTMRGEETRANCRTAQLAA